MKLRFLLFKQSHSFLYPEKQRILSGYTIAIFLVLILNLVFSKSYAQEDRKIIALVLGLSTTEIDNEYYTLRDFYSDYPTAGYSTVNYNGYEFDSKSYKSNGGQSFLNYAGLEFSKPFINKKQKIFNRTDQRVKLTASFALTETYYSNLEKLYDYIQVSGGKMVSRDFYAAVMSMDIYSASYSWVHKSNYKFKNERTRIFVGLGYNTGIVSQRAYFTHLNGSYFIPTGEEDVTHNYYNYPHEASWEIRDEADCNLGKRFFTGFEIPFGIETLLGKNKRFHCGMIFYMGGIWLIGNNKSVRGVYYNTGGLSLRWDLGI